MLGTIDDLAAYTRDNSVDEIFVALPAAGVDRVPDYLSKLKTIPVRVSVWSDWIGFEMRIRGVSDIAGAHILRIYEKPLSGWPFVGKAIEDRILALFFVVLLAPLMLILAIAVKSSNRGPALFRQQRYGFNNDIFTVYKFRTMYSDRAEEPDVPQARRSDPRVTPIGRILRRTSLDELPQLFNVLEGTMSIVGPRPHAVAHNEKYAAIIGQYLGRHKMKLGITGWAQVNGLRGPTESADKMQRRIEHDLFYIDNWSLLFDMRILIMTVFSVLMDRNAF